MIKSGAYRILTVSFKEALHRRKVSIGGRFLTNEKSSWTPLKTHRFVSVGRGVLHRNTSLVLSLLFCSASATAVEFADYDYDQFSQAVTLCDQLAAHGRDPGHVAPAVDSATMDKPAAIGACHNAVSNDPENPRLNYQLGRAYGYSGQGERDAISTQSAGG